MNLDDLWQIRRKTEMIKYAASYGRMRALKGYLLSTSELKKLVDAPSANEVIVMLGNLGYDGLLDKHESLSNNELEHALKQELVASHIKVFSFMSGSFIKFANLLMQRFELTNLKTILRVLSNPPSAKTAEPFILKLGKFHSLPIENLLSAGNMEDCVEILKDTPFDNAFRRAYENYRSDQNLFSFEVALELDYYDRLTENLRIIDDGSLFQMIGSEIDAKCIAWALRFRYNYKLEQEQIFQYMIIDRWQFTEQLFWAVTSPDEIEDAITAFSSSPYSNLSDQIDLSDNDIIAQVEIFLQRELYQKARRLFIKEPLRMAVLPAYFVLKRSEIYDLIAIIYGKLLELPPERIERYLVTAKVKE